MAEETCGFYAGVLLVVTGMIFIVGMGIYSIHNPMEVPDCGEPEKLDNGEIVLSMADADIPDKNKTMIFFTCNTGMSLVTFTSDPILV